MRLEGGRTGVRAVTCKGLELTGLMKPFDLEVFYGERVAVLGSNGSGKSHFLRLLAGERRRAHGGVEARRARRARALRPDARPPGAAGPHPARHPVEASTPRTGARRCRALRRYELTAQAEQPFDRLSGGQQARFQILLLELAGRHRAAARRADRQPRPGVAPRRSRRAWRPSRARCSRSPTTAGSPAPSTATWSSARTAASARRRSRCGTRAGWPGSDNGPDHPANPRTHPAGPVRPTHPARPDRSAPLPRGRREFCPARSRLSEVPVGPCSSSGRAPGVRSQVGPAADRGPDPYAGRTSTTFPGAPDRPIRRALRSRPGAGRGAGRHPAHRRRPRPRPDSPRRSLRRGSRRPPSPPLAEADPRAVDVPPPPTVWPLRNCDHCDRAYRAPQPGHCPPLRADPAERGLLR